MILSDREIWMEISSGHLSFDPEIEFNQVVPSAVDLRLGNQFTTFKTQPVGVDTLIDLAQVSNVEDIATAYGDTQFLKDGEAFRLEPGQFLLAYTMEYVKLPNYLAARVEGRSSLARLGISIHQTAPTVHATFEGQLRLEISLTGPYSCLLYPGQKICQLIIERLGTPAQTHLNSQFQQQRQQAR